MNEIRYDTSPFTPDDEDLPLPSVRRELATASTPSLVGNDDPRTIGLRGAAIGPEPLLSRTWFDPWGSSVAACGGYIPEDEEAPTEPPDYCMRFGTVTYDTVFSQFPIEETAFVSATASLSTTVPMTGGDPGWDRGLGAVRRVVDPNDEDTRITHDGLGRLTAMTPPASGECDEDVPTTVLGYELTSDGASTPMSRVVTTQVLRTDGCDFEGLGDEPPTSTAMGYVDGLGRVRATLTQAEGDGSQTWIRSGLTVLDRKGQVIRAYHPTYFGELEDDFPSVLTPSLGTPSVRTDLDAFGRTRFIYAEDGSITTTSFHAASTTVCDPLDNAAGTIFHGTCSTSRTDGFGRVIDQILVQSTDAGTSDDRYHRLWSYYRADGVVLSLVRTETTNQNVRPALDEIEIPHVRRDFHYDSVGRRLGSDDPDTNNLPYGETQGQWRYNFNQVGDLVGVYDPRDCGQIFFYDLGGRLIGEQYVGCSEVPDPSVDYPMEELPAGAVGEGVTIWPAVVDVRYFYDELPAWASGLGAPTVGGTAGRATGVSDRGQRSVVAYDRRGNAIWTARQMALIGGASDLSRYYANSWDETYGAGDVIISQGYPEQNEVTYDEDHTYIRTSEYDHAGRGLRLVLPLDPDFDGTAPEVRGELSLNRRGLPMAASAFVGEEEIPVLNAVDYDQYGQVETRSWGAEESPVLDELFEYDIRNRPVLHEAVRTPTMGAAPETIADVSYVAREEFGWDAASNLISIRDLRPADEWPDGHRARNTVIMHDALYRVAQVYYEYRLDDGYGTDTGTDWRGDALASNGNDPMHPVPAPRIGGLSATRIMELDYEWDYLGNQIAWLDDAFEDETNQPLGQTFYERGIGGITNGNTEGASEAPLRPSALYFATNIPTTGVEEGWEGAGWTEVRYGPSGNVDNFTVHGHCTDVTEDSCHDIDDDVEARIDYLHDDEHCVCADVQHYEFHYDELNRLIDGSRWDWDGDSWEGAARMRYRYDSANQRTVKEVLSGEYLDESERVTLYVYPGDYERRGLVRGTTSYDAVTTGEDATETQYLVAGARIVWDADESTGTFVVDRNRRATISAGDLLGTTAASLDLETGELLEVSTYYPNGARENLWAYETEGIPLEPSGFTGKEADEEIGVVYFGERWLIPRLGRWSTPDPLHVHAAGGGEALNSYHYVSGNLLQATDPLGLQDVSTLADRYGATDSRAIQVSDTTLPNELSDLEAGDYFAVGENATTVRSSAATDLEAFFSEAAAQGLTVLRWTPGIGRTLAELSEPGSALDWLTEQLNAFQLDAPDPGGAGERGVVGGLCPSCELTEDQELVAQIAVLGYAVYNAIEQLGDLGVGQLFDQAVSSISRRLPPLEFDFFMAAPSGAGGRGRVDYPSGGGVIEGTGVTTGRPVPAEPPGRIVPPPPSPRQAQQAAAEALGYTQRVAPNRLPFDSHGQPAFFDGQRYITPDVDSHRGGIWKMFDRDGTRLGTFDAELTRIGD